MTQGRKMAPRMPIYTIVDKNRPLPNFLVDRTSLVSKDGWQLLMFSSPSKAITVAQEMMKFDKELKLDFAIIQTADEFRGILVALKQIFDRLIWVHLDLTKVRRAPKRYLIKDLINNTHIEQE